MRTRQRQISLKECYAILHLEKGADLQALKSAYRRRAFELHPDLNPGNPQASHDFQLLNEAYVALSAVLKPAEEAKQRAEARKGAKSAQESGKRKEEKTENQQEAKEEEKKEESEKRAREEETAQKAYAEQDVLRDLLNDPFARRVFEDIYSELSRQQSAKEPKPEPEQKQTHWEKIEKRPRKEEEPTQLRPAPMWPKGQQKGVRGVVKDWLRKQIDEEQTLILPGAGLIPGRKIRLKVRRGISDEVNSVEVTLPADFALGKPMRLRGLGKRVGPWQGDLYLTINAR